MPASTPKSSQEDPERSEGGLTRASGGAGYSLWKLGLPRGRKTMLKRAWPPVHEGFRMARVMAVVVALVMAGCTSDGSAPQEILKTAPRTDCPVLIRADGIKPAQLSQTVRGHIPHWLPDSFGLQHSFGTGEGISGGAAWTDDRCREVLLILWQTDGTDDFEGPKVGAWTVTENDPGECGNAVLGMSRCLTYHTSTSEGTLSLQLIGLERAQGDRIAKSIPKYVVGLAYSRASWCLRFESTVLLAVCGDEDGRRPPAGDVPPPQAAA